MICINETQEITKEDIDRICKKFSKIKHKHKVVVDTYHGVVKEAYEKYKRVEGWKKTR